MSYKEKAAAGDYRGGRIEPDAPKLRPLYPCFASECPQPGTIFANGTDKAGTCAYHYGVVGNDIPRVTQVLKDWDCVAYEIREARRALCNPDIAMHPSVLAERFATAWERLEPLAGDYVDHLRPTSHDYGDWAKHLERFIGGRVVETLGVRAPRRPTPSARAHAFAPLPTPAPQAGQIADEVLQ